MKTPNRPIYCKSPTPEMIDRVEELRRQDPIDPAEFHELMQLQDKSPDWHGWVYGGSRK